MASSTHQPETDEIEKKPLLGENLRGVLIVLAGSTVLVAVAYFAMVAVTGPDGWATRMANSAVSEEATLTSFETPE